MREITGLGDWDGTALTLPLPLERLAAERRDGAAVLVQRQADGAILAARRIDLAPELARKIHEELAGADQAVEIG